MDEYWKALIAGLTPEDKSQVSFWWKIPTLMIFFIFLFSLVQYDMTREKLKHVVKDGMLIAICFTIVALIKYDNWMQRNSNKGYNKYEF